LAIAFSPDLFQEKKNALIGHFQEFAADRKDFSFFFQSNVVLQFILKNNIVRKKI